MPVYSTVSAAPAFGLYLIVTDSYSSVQLPYLFTLCAGKVIYVPGFSEFVLLAEDARYFYNS